MRSKSIEWWTNIADEIVIASVAQVKAIDPLNEYHHSQQVTCRKAEGLRGSSVDGWSFRHDYNRTEKVDHGISEGQKLLLFIVREPYRNDKNPVHWVNLSAPDVPHATHAAYDNDAHHLAEEENILKVVRSRLKGEAAEKAPRKRGVIIMFPDVDDMYWDFVRTADPDFKPKLLNQLSSQKSDPCSAIHNLVSYPGAETVNAIRPFLKDATTQEVQFYGERKETIRYYPVRQAAYLALTLLGEEVEKPQPYFEDMKPWLFKVGFEDRVYFHYGDWKRFKE